MQNAQNTEIQQRVMNLVELYRTKIGKESKIAKDAKAEKACWDKVNLDAAIKLHEDGLGAFGFDMSPDMPEEWVKTLRVNDHLLGHFYSEVAGNNADKDVLSQFLADYYDATVFTADEEDFLRSHFKEMVNYIIQTPCDDLDSVNRYDGKDVFTIPCEVLELIKSRTEISAGSKVYYPKTYFAQLANLFEGCKYYCDSMFYAWTRVALYANNIDAEDNATPSSYDAIVSYLPKDDDDSKTIARLCEAYKNLPIDGKLVLICPSNVLADKGNTSYRRTLSETLKYKENSSFKEKLDEEIASADVNAHFRRMLIEDRSIKEIIQMPQVMGDNASSDKYCLLIAEKGHSESDVVLIDARLASNDSDTKHHMLSFDNAKFNAILQNDGIDPNTGLRKVVKVTSEGLSPEILIPQVYVIERPSEAEHPVPLSSLCSLESIRVRDLQFDLPEDTRWITMSDLTPLYTGDLVMSGIRKADCPNNPPYVEGSKEYGFDKNGKFVDSIWGQLGKSKGHHVLDYRKCTYLDGNSDAVLYERSVESGVQVAVVRATGKPFAVSSGILVFCPKDNFDANSLAALLRLPVVYRQMLAYQGYGLGNPLDDILVPTDKRIIFDELLRMKKEESVTKEMGDKVQAMKTEYINEVRMRKHDMRPHLRQLASSQRLMLHYIDCASDIEELKRNLRNQLEHIHVALTSLSSIVDHLSDEEKFGTPELLNIDSLLTDIEVNHDESEGFAIEYDCDKESFKKQGFVIPDLSEQWQLAKDHGLDMAKFVQAKSKENLPLFVNIAPVDFQRMVDNIIENARKHGFTDHTRTDYYMGIDLSINTERNMYQIDFYNNGTPLPDGMTKARYGLKGEKAGQTGGTGSGGYIVRSIVSHYGGDYDVICEDGITTIRIYLPIERYENKV